MFLDSAIKHLNQEGFYFLVYLYLRRPVRCKNKIVIIIIISFLKFSPDIRFASPAGGSDFVQVDVLPLIKVNGSTVHTIFKSGRARAFKMNIPSFIIKVL